MPTSLPPCPDSPNCVSTQANQPDKKREPIPYTSDRETTLGRIKRVVSALPRTELVVEEANYLHFTFRTWPIPYTDDVEFLLDDAAKLIHYRSASRKGYHDLGVNGRRMARIAAQLAE